MDEKEGLPPVSFQAEASLGERAAPPGKAGAPGEPGVSGWPGDSRPKTPPGIVMRVHRRGGEVLVAACDEELLGREIRVGQRAYLVSSSFYGSMRVGAGELLAHLGLASVANLLGARTVRHAVEGGLVKGNATSLLDGIPHAEIVRL